MTTTPYEIFGKFYDATMGDRTNAAAYIRGLIKRHKPDAITVLEAACGTGAILQTLAKYYDVSGFDRSPTMLALARKKLPYVGLFRQDMAQFKIRKKFDVIICVFDSINHLLQLSDWRKFFRRVASHLARDGLFIFDINTVGKLRRLVKDPIWIKQFARGLVLIDVTGAPGGIVYWNLKVFERQKGDVFRLFEETIKEVSFPLNNIKKALKAQFARFKIIDPTGSRVSDQSDRLFFICKAR